MHERVINYIVSFMALPRWETKKADSSSSSETYYAAIACAISPAPQLIILLEFPASFVIHKKQGSDEFITT